MRICSRQPTRATSVSSERPIILTDFTYTRAKIYGGELTANYQSGPWSAYGNLGWATSLANGISSAQFNFGADELAYINSHWIYADHDQRWTSSAGVSYRINRDTDHPTLLSMDFLGGSGLRASTATVPNGIALPGYGEVNLSVVQKLKTGVGAGTELRLDVLNAGDTIYEIRNGTGVSVRRAAIWAAPDDPCGHHATLLILLVMNSVASDRRTFRTTFARPPDHGRSPSMPALPFKLNQDRRHHIPRRQHRVANWAAYEAGLRQRRSMTVWFTLPTMRSRRGQRRHVQLEVANLRVR